MSENPSRPIIAVIGLVAAAVVVVWGGDFIRSEKGSELVGKTILPAESVATIDEISFVSGSATFGVKKTEDRWQQSSDGFPVDASRVVQLFDELQKARIVRQAAKAGADGTEFGLTDQADQVTLKSAGKDVLNLRLGGRRDGGGRFIRMGASDAVWQADRGLELPASSKDWDLKVLAQIKREDVKSIVATPPKAERAKAGGVAAVSRSKEAEPLSLQGLKGKEKAKENDVVAWADAFSSVRFQGRVRASEAGAQSMPSGEAAWILAIELLNGSKFEFAFGPAQADKRQMRFSGSGPSFSTVWSTLSSEWVFEITSADFDRMIKRRTDLVSR